MARRALFALPVAALVIASCSLDLDESLIGRIDAGASVVFVPEAGGDAGGGGGGLVAECTKNDDCATIDACLKGRCDVARKRCIYDVCTQTVCTTQICDQVARRCGAPKTYSYNAAEFPVGAGVGCGGQAARCIAAAYPYVFVGTTDGVVAFSAADPSATAPTPVPVTGLGFLPTQMLASGGRVFFLGAPGGTGTSSRIPIGVLPVPVDPFAKTLAATTILATVDRGAGDPFVLAQGENAAAWLVDASAAGQWAVAKLEPPLADPLSLKTYPLPVTAGASLLAPSGPRYLTQTPPPAVSGVPSFGFVTGVGTATSTSLGEAALPAVAPVAQGPQTVAVAPEGAVLWVAEYLTAPQVPGPAYVRAVKAWFLVADAAAPAVGTAGIDIETYRPGQVGVGAAVVGPAAMLDSTMAMVTAAVAPGLIQTTVQFVQRNPLGVLPKKATIALGVGALGAAASRGIGYVLAAESTAASSVHVYAPECAP